MRQPAPVTEVDSLLADIEAEAASETERSATLNRESIRPLRKELLDLAKAGGAALKGDPAKRLDAHLVGERLGSSKLAQDVQERCGVGANFNAEAPLEIHDNGNRVLDALRDADNAELFKARGFEAALYAGQLEPLLKTLKKEIDEGVGPGPKKGEGTDLIGQALLFLEIALSRTANLLEDFAAEAAAQTLRSRIPRKHYRRATDRKPDNGEPERPPPSDPQPG